MKAAIKLTMAVALVLTVMTGILFSQPVRSEPIEVKTFDFNDAAAATYKLWRNDQAGCSGVFIESSKERDIFITAAHCGDAVGRYSIRLGTKGVDYKIYTLMKVRMHIDSDVMVFKTYSPALKVFNTAPLATLDERKSIKFGDGLMTIGYPRGGSLVMLDGKFMNMTLGELPKFSSQSFYKTTVQLIPGMSGGPLWMTTATGDMRLIGLSSHFIQSTPIGFFSSYEAIMGILNGLVGDA